ncbi:MAG: DNA repair protein RadC [Chloroflexi bacterium]|nr:DNA repair protein RadC [Chloroflexota bacterium]
MYQQINPVAETEEETGVMLFPVTKSLETYTQSTLFESLPIRERPGTRISELGPQACTDYELLATVIGGKYQIEVAQTLISKYGDLYKIYNAHTSVLAREIKGLTEATAIKLKAALAIGLRMAKNPTVEKPAINSPSDAAAIVQYEMGGLTAEELWVMCLDRRNRVLEIRHLYRGSVSSSQVRIGEIFELPIQIKASAIICMHNHPSGDPTPSPDDVALTRAIVQAGKLLDVDLLDHLVIAQGRWISLKERGLGFS